MIQRIIFLGNHVLGYRVIDPQLFTQSLLQPVVDNWTNVLASVSGYDSSRNVDHLRNAQGHAEASLTHIGLWPEATAKGGAATKAKATYEAYIASTEQLIISQRDQFSVALQNAEQVVAALQGQVQGVDVSVEALNATAMGIAASLEGVRGQLDTLVADAQVETERAATERERRFADWLTEQEAEFTRIADGHLSQAKASVEQSAQARDEIEDLKRQTERVASAATSAILARDYGAYSTREWWSGVVAYLLGFLALVGAAIFLFRVVSAVTAEERISWQFVTLKFGVAASVVGAASVAFQLGGRFLTRAAKNKRVELELRAIGPILADIEDSAVVQKAKIEFVAKMFGNAWNDDGADAGREELVRRGDLADFASQIVRSLGLGKP